MGPQGCVCGVAVCQLLLACGGRFAVWVSKWKVNVKHAISTDAGATSISVLERQMGV
jgi:hypothetical protein